MSLPTFDVLDRGSIAQLKAERVGEQCAKDEFRHWMAEIERLQIEHPDWPLSLWYQAILEINGNIWDVEHPLRKGDPNALQLDGHALPEGYNVEQVLVAGILALRVRDINRRRVALGNAICDETGTGFRDITMNSEARAAS